MFGPLFVVRAVLASAGAHAGALSVRRPSVKRVGLRIKRISQPKTFAPLKIDLSQRARPVEWDGMARLVDARWVHIRVN